jgi:ureidoglycolate lyase
MQGVKGMHLRPACGARRMDATLHHADAGPAMRLIAQPLTAEAFAPFGQVLEAPAAVGRVAAQAALANRRPEVPVSLSLVTKAPAALPLRSTTMERHPFSSQSFLPLDAGAWLVMVAPHAASGGPDMARAQAFLARGDQGVTYGVDVWHHPFTVLDRIARFAVLMWKDGTPADDDFVEVAPFDIVRP